jgi:hypothetical protein
MKLIRKSERRLDIATLRGRSGLAGLVARIATGVKPKIDTHYQGRVTWGHCHIQFDVVQLYPQKWDIVFGSELYQGVTPLRHLGDCVYECSVDIVTEVFVGKIALEMP